MTNEFVILVDTSDREIGTMEKMEAHRKGVLHRAFSIFVFNSKQELMLQRRAFHKYHSGGLWTNTCCSHPRAGESLEYATQRRLQEEMGFTCKVQKAFDFMYEAHLDHNLIEKELDHVFIGFSDVQPKINPEEVAEWKYLSLDAIKKEISEQPDTYTAWFKIILNRVDEYLKNHSLVIV